MEINNKTGASMENTELPYTPLMAVVIAVEDIDQAKIFYQKLGFHEEMSLRGDDGQTIHVTLKFGFNILMLGRVDQSHYDQKERTKRICHGPRGLGVTLQLVVPDLMAVYACVQAASLEILLEPVDEFYGDRVFMFIDPFGYEWKIAQTIQHMSPHEVIAASGLHGTS